MSQPSIYEQWKQKQAQQAPEEDFEELGEDAPLPSMVPREASLVEKPEFFQWTEDRDRQIQELLETTVPGTLPSVHRQLQSIRQALQAEELPDDRGRQLLAEVLGYLRQKEQQLESRPNIQHPSVQEARQEQSRALSSWREAAESLLTFLGNRESVYLEVANYAADQGSAYMAASRRLLLECEPEPGEDVPAEPRAEETAEEPPEEEEPFEEDYPEDE